MSTKSAPQWRKSSLSSSNGGNCVEVADNLPARVLVRDSKDTSGPTLTFSPAAWHSFVADPPTTTTN
ncbi:DUF397 domain-containing protein [Micromonospora sp. NBC_01813]|uniref:DUF397 domain-containing protein n=1 Tax=Micromonospora sp. NBC_01813 TaxID=2975988 RepID=UPI002DD89ACB|nr:DUF397 domain-containing protein [Micromonospora sp. NBC_01813]WSA11759.1 DUF397 domain-containing protein [Micromonospora sp. NBC_01813]